MDIKTTPPPNQQTSTTSNTTNVSGVTSPPSTPPSPMAVSNAVASSIAGLTDVQKQTFQHIFEKLVVNSGGSAKVPPKQYEYFRNLLENVRDPKNLQMIVEKFKNLEHIDGQFSLQIGNKNSNIIEGKLFWDIWLNKISGFVKAVGIFDIVYIKQNGLD